MSRTLSLAELAAETGTTAGMILRLTRIGVLQAAHDGSYAAGDVIKTEAVVAFLNAGITLDQVELALAEGRFTFEFLDRFYPEPAPLSDHTYADFTARLGAGAGVLAAVYAAMGLPEPAPDHRMRQDEEAIVSDFLETWAPAGDDDSYVRAARLVGEPSRLMSEGWTRLYVEKMGPAFEGMEPEERIRAIVATTERATALGPKMLMWLMQRHLRHAIDQANIEGFERGLAEKGLALPRPDEPPAIAFVDIAGYTRLTERHGDELAAGIAAKLRSLSERVARPRGGSVVKLLGDGVMLHFDAAAGAVDVVVDLMGSLQGEGLEAHAGVSAGPLIERDGDFYGRTANLASRLADAAGAGEVIVNDVVQAVSVGSRFSFEPVQTGGLKGIDRLVTAYRVEW